MVEVIPERNLQQGGRPHKLIDGLVEFPPERQVLQEDWPHNFRDGVVEVIPERNLQQGGRPHNLIDGLVDIQVQIPQGSRPGDHPQSCTPHHLSRGVCQKLRCPCNRQPQPPDLC